jgi:hypothetical protein
VVEPAVFESVSKFSVAGEPMVVRLTAPLPVSASTVLSTNPLRKLLAGSSSDRATIHAKSIANLLRTETAWLFSVMRIGTSSEF